MASEIMVKLASLRNYTEAIGWTLVEIQINEDYVLDNPKLGLLKLTNVGDIVHEVGLKASDELFYVMQQPEF
jgi:hypothetical protein